MKLESIVQNEISFVDSISNLYRLDTGRGYSRYYPVRKERRERLSELSFLIIYIAWEHFLEDTFLDYLVLGQRRNPKVKAKIQLKDLNTAYGLIQPEGGQHVIWTQVERVEQRAKRFFVDGEPYSTALKSSKQHLEDMRFIRNCAVHQSSKSKAQFIKLVVTRIYGVSINYSPGEFLLNSPPSGLPPSPTTTVPVFRTIFEHYGNVLLTTCREIA